MSNHNAEENAKYDNIIKQQESREYKESIQLNLFSEKEWGDILFQKEMDAGAIWHKVDAQPIDPNAKSIPLQTCDDNGVCEEPYVIYKLKYPTLPGDTPVTTQELIQTDEK